jgi:hypothetical protein
MNHVIYKYSMYNSLTVFLLHEDYLLAVDCHILVIFHPCRYADIPLPCGLPSSVHTSHQEQSMPLWNSFRPPVWSADVNFLVSNLSVEESLLGV